MMQAFYINRAVALAYKPIIAMLKIQHKLLEGVYAS